MSNSPASYIHIDLIFDAIIYSGPVYSGFKHNLEGLASQALRPPISGDGDQFISLKLKNPNHVYIFLK